MELDAHGLLDEWVGGIPKGTDFDRHGSDCELGRRDSRIQIFYIIQINSRYTSHDAASRLRVSISS